MEKHNKLIGVKLKDSFYVDFKDCELINDVVREIQKPTIHLSNGKYSPINIVFYDTFKPINVTKVLFGLNHDVNIEFELQELHRNGDLIGTWSVLAKPKIVNFNYIIPDEDNTYIQLTLFPEEINYK